MGWFVVVVVVVLLQDLQMLEPSLPAHYLNFFLTTIMYLFGLFFFCHFKMTFFIFKKGNDLGQLFSLWMRRLSFGISEHLAQVTQEVSEK